MWRYPGERFNATNFLKTIAFGVGSVTVLGGDCLGARTEFLVVENRSLRALKYISDILELLVMTFAPFNAHMVNEP